jgi:hypothetical protein
LRAIFALFAIEENARTMIFFRWYGVNVDTFLDVPTFHQPWKYIETISG